MIQPKNETDCQWNRRPGILSRRPIIIIIGSQVQYTLHHGTVTAPHLHHRQTARKYYFNLFTMQSIGICSHQGRRAEKIFPIDFRKKIERLDRFVM